MRSFGRSNVVEFRDGSIAEIGPQFGQVLLSGWKRN
jgi:hypothetical protein